MSYIYLMRSGSVLSLDYLTQVRESREYVRWRNSMVTFIHNLGIPMPRTLPTIPGTPEGHCMYTSVCHIALDTKRHKSTSLHNEKNPTEGSWRGLPPLPFVTRYKAENHTILDAR